MAKNRPERVWNKHLVSRLVEVGFKQSKIDEERVFYRGKSICVLYSRPDDSDLAGPDDQELDQIIEDMKNAGLDLTVEGGISDFLGVEISSSHTASSYCIDQLLSNLHLSGNEGTWHSYQANSGGSESIITAPLPELTRF
jgi:hypothetical protein